MIIPCIDLMEGKVVQLVQGRDKALEAESVDRMLEKFRAFHEIQAIDLDAAMNRGSNDALIAHIAEHAAARIGGGIRTPERAREMIGRGAHRVIVGTSAFHARGVNHDLLRQMPRDHLIIALDSRNGRITVQGWRESIEVKAEDVVRELEPYCSGFLCTYVDKEGTMQGTDLEWFGRLRAATAHEITAAGGISSIEEIMALNKLRIHAALGMAIYTGRLDLSELARISVTGAVNAK
jgi:phosphoribosylformimino-5-aminoimidazole carboxamide ribotide isomerase